MPLIPNNEEAIPILADELDEFFYKLPVTHPMSNRMGLIKCRFPFIDPINLNYSLKLPTTHISIKRSCNDDLFLMDKVPKSKQVDFVRVGAMPNGQNNGDDASFFDFLRNEGQINYAENLDSAKYFKDHHFTLPLGELLTKAKEIHDDISGVTTKYYYVGCQNALFALHTEDSDLAAINVNLGGADKIWFSMGPESYKKARRLIEQDLMDSPCAHPLRHKYQWPLPEFFTRQGLDVYRTVQRPMDAIYNIPGAVHWGYSPGINVGVAWNYGGLSWAGHGMDSQHCECIPSYAKINVWEVSREYLRPEKNVKKPPWLKKMDDVWNEKWNTPFFLSYFPNTFPIFPSNRVTLKNLPSYGEVADNLNSPSTLKDPHSNIPLKYYCHNNIYYNGKKHTKDLYKYQCCTDGCHARLNREKGTWAVSLTGTHTNAPHSYVPPSEFLSMKFKL